MAIVANGEEKGVFDAGFVMEIIYYGFVESCVMFWDCSLP